MSEQLSSGLLDALLDEVIAQMANGTIHIYSGSQPADADTAESGTLLCKITLDSGTFTGDPSTTNGINFDKSGTAQTAKLVISSGETWSGTAVATGTAGWFRFYSNAYTTGGSTSAVNFDGRVATSGAELNLNTTSIVTDGPVIISSFEFTIPVAG